MPGDDERLRHMLDAAQEAVALLGQAVSDDVRDSRMLALSLVKLLEIVGEAASRVSESRRVSLGGIPWADVIATRNRLIHGYFDIDSALVVATVRDDLPPLIKELQRELGNG